MTSLEKVLKKHKITKYRLIKWLGRDTSKEYTYFSEKISGKRPMSLVELTDICDVLSYYTRRSYAITDFAFDIEKLLLK